MTQFSRPPDVMASFSGEDPESGIIYRKATIKDAKPFQFAWENRVLLGYVNLLVGIEGIGKGTLVSWALSHITQGTLPGALFGTPSNVGIIGDEDSFENVWIPRVHAAGGDTDKVLLLESAPGHDDIEVHRDADAIHKFVSSQTLVVLYFDQLLDNLGYADSWKDKHVRTAIAPLRKVASVANIGVLATLHPNKQRGKSFRETLSGTSAFNAVSRSSLLVARHPFQSNLVVAVRPKGNYNVEPPAFEFEIESHSFKTPGRRNRQLISTSRIADWRDNPDIDKDDVLNAGTGGSRLRADSKAGVARAALIQMFANGEPRPSAEVLGMLKTLHGLDERTISRAANDIGLHKTQKGFPAVWWWSRQ